MQIATPENYAELHLSYRSYTEGLVRKWGVTNPEDVQDIASVILTKFIERDMLKEYDSSRDVLFSTFLGGFISAYVRYMRDKINLDKWREGTSHDVVWGASSGFTMYDAVAPKHLDDTTDIEYLEFVKRCRSHLATMPPLNKNDRMNPVAVFDLIVLHEYEHGRIHISEMAKHFSISINTAKTWIKRVQVWIAPVVHE